MSVAHVLVTGGAGFIGSHLVDRLVTRGTRVRVLDVLEPQVHGGGRGIRNPGAEYIEGSVGDAELVRQALAGVDAVVHLAAQVGVGQSMYEIVRYVRENSLGTAVLLEAMAERRDELAALVVASSMSIYGEGRYDCSACGTADTEVVRSLDGLQLRQWEPVCRRCGQSPRAVPTPESKRLQSDSVYAVTKRDHEDLSLVFGRAYGVRTVALRFFNVYGPRQALSNPYTGVAAIFAGRLLNGRPPVIFEDGLQSRDFIHVSDVVTGIESALGSEAVDGVAVNLGTGVATTVRQVADRLADALGVPLEPEVNGRFRHGDIRHCVADPGLAAELLGFTPVIGFDEGLRELTAWIAETSPAAEDHGERSAGELTSRRLVL